MAPNSNSNQRMNHNDGRNGKKPDVYSISYRHQKVAPPRFSKKTERLINDAKRKHRSELPVVRWAKDGFAGSDICELAINETRSITKEHCKNLSVEDFIEKYEKPILPVIIDGIPEHEGWSATEKWTLSKLKRNYRTAEFKCGEDDKGKSVRFKFKYFAKYMKTQIDDSPLYIFDSSFDDRKDTTPLLKDYATPRYFPDDLFQLVGERRRPPYRWFLVGPKRSGTCVHIDPLGTSAWNTLISGRKRWILFPPSVSKRLAKGKDFVYRGEDDEAINYFADILPRLKSKHPDVEYYELIQYPGETIFIPGGWWHGVLNIDDTVAVTQNFCSKTNFPVVWRKTRVGRKRMAVKWLSKLEESFPKLAKKARKLNAEDQYVMYSKEEGTPSSKKK